ncbi:MAG TPA: hypothetical protein VGC22_12990, partial [Chitinophaga sp.]
ALVAVKAQEATAVSPRPLTMAEYEKAKTYTIKDLDNDTYAKFDNAYVLDRYEQRKPYFITGDDGKKKRIDLYKLVAKDGMQEIGTVIFYTSETGRLYTSVLPDFTADAKVWERYFEDIHAIDKTEPFYVLKLSYILSKEFSFQLFKALNQGKAPKEEDGTYGNDICFPGTDKVRMADGSEKLLRNIRPGDQVVTVDPTSRQPLVTTVKQLVTHTARNYAITQLLVWHAETRGNEIQLHSKVLEATPNHPMRTGTGQKNMGDISEGEAVLCLDAATGAYRPYTVARKTETAAGVQPVYNMVTDSGSTFIMNGVMVMSKGN